MIIEILYKGKMIRTVDLPEVTSPSGLDIAMRIMSKGEKEAVIVPDIGKRLQFHGNKGKKLIKDKPRADIPQKLETHFERPKGSYSNTQW